MKFSRRLALDRTLEHENTASARSILHENPDIGTQIRQQSPVAKR
jgi:hypothetical protein